MSGQAAPVRSTYSRSRQFRLPRLLCMVLLALVLMVGVAIFTSMGQIMSGATLLSAEQLMNSTFGEGVFASERTREERAWEREKIRRKRIRERLQARKDSLVFAGNNSTIQSSKYNSVIRTGTPPNISSSGKFDWHQPPVRTNLTLKDPQLYRNDTMVILVLSARANFKRRAVIRETWAQKHAVYFVIGARGLPEEDSVQSRLVKEQDSYKDMLDSLHPDMYSSLPYKLRFAYHWITTRLPHVEWLVKVDDDTVVRVDTLQNAFLRSFNPNVPVVVGRIIERSPVAQEGKWRETQYDELYYPFWPQGSCGHVVSQVVARYIANMEPRSFTYYQGEDVSVGIWLDQAPPDKLEPVTWIHSSYFSNDRKCLTHAWLIMGHDVTPDEMRACHRARDEWPVEEVTHKHWNYWVVDTLKRKKDRAVPSWME